MKNYVGIPYVEYGRDRNGVDCYGLLVLFYKEQYNIDLPTYETEQDIVKEGEENWCEVDKPRTGDAVLLRQFRVPTHVGVMCDDWHFLHCEDGIGVVRQRIDDPKWCRRIVKYYRHKKCSAALCYAKTSPLCGEKKVIELQEGMTVEDVVNKAADPRFYDCAHIFIHGQHVPREVWKDTTIKAGALANLVYVPRGRGRGFLRAILSIAVMAWAGGSGGAFFSRLLGGARVSPFTRALGSAIANATGMLLINALIPPPRQNMDRISDTDNTYLYEITGSQNRINPYGSIPIICGKHKIFPPYAAKPYTELQGDDQILHCLFAVGYGPLTITDLKLGNTDLNGSNFDLVSGPTIYEGVPADPTPTFLDVDEANPNIELKFVDSWSTTFTTPTDTDEFSVDLTFPQGLCRINNEGEVVERQVSFDIRIAPAGSGSWSTVLGRFVQDVAINDPGNGYTVGVYALDFTGAQNAYGVNAELNAYVDDTGKILAQGGAPVRRIDSLASSGNRGNGYTGAVTASMPAGSGGSNATFTVTLGDGYAFKERVNRPFRRSFRFAFPSQGQWDVQLRRTSADSTSTQDIDTFVWSAFRSIKNQNAIANLPYDLAMVEFAIKATNQLNGVVQTFSCIAQSRGYKWNGATWDSDQEIDAPHDLYRYLLQGPFNARAVADSRIDLARLGEWGDFNIAEGFKFNAMFDSPIVLREALRFVAAAGRGSHSMINNTFSVVWDYEQSLINNTIQMFTPSNVKSFSASRIYITEPHAFRVRFIDENNEYTQVERIVYGPGYDDTNATIFERLDLFGVTDVDLIDKLGTYHILCAKYRQETFTIEVDAEHLVCTRGDLVVLQHDSALKGISSGRVKSISDDYVTVDNVVPMEAGGTYFILFRKEATPIAGGLSVLVANEGDNYKLEYSSGAPFTTLGDVGYLYTVFTQAGAEPTWAIVQNIEPMPDLEARLTLLPYNPLIYDDEGPFPPYTAGVDIPSDLLWPDAPRELAVNEVLFREQGTLQQGAYFKWYHPENLIVDYYEAEILRPDTTNYEPIGTTTETAIVTYNLPAGDYNFRVRTIKGLRSSEWATLTGVTISDPSTFVGDVTGLRTIFRNGKVIITWNEVSDIRPIVYEIRRGDSWDSGTLEATVLTREYQPILAGRYMVRARTGDTTYSQNTAAIVVSSVNLPVNVIQSIDEADDGWTGTFTDSADVASPCYPTPPTSFDVTYDPNESPDVQSNEVEYEGNVLPSADGWTSGGTTEATASSDGDILTIGPLGIGQTTYWFRTLTLTKPWLASAARWEIDSGNTTASQFVYSATMGVQVQVNMTSDTNMRITASTIVNVPIVATDYNYIYIELSATWCRVFVNTVLVYSGAPNSYSGGGDGAYFGKTFTTAEATSSRWDFVTLTQADYAGQGINEPPAENWAQGGTDNATVEDNYLEIDPTNVTCIYLQNPARDLPDPTADGGMYAEFLVDANDATRGAIMRMRSGAILGSGIQLNITNTGSCNIGNFGSSSADLGSFVVNLGGAQKYGVLLTSTQAWIFLNDRLIWTGEPEISASGGTVCIFGCDGLGTSRHRWYYFKVKSITMHENGIRVDGAYGLTGYYQTKLSNVVDLGSDGIVIVDSDTEFHGSNQTTDLLTSPDLLSEDDLFFNASSDVTVEPQIRIKKEGAADWEDVSIDGGWKTLVSGQYEAEEYDTRLKITVADEDTIAIVDDWDWSIDMEDRVINGTEAVNNVAGITVTFPRPFQVVPNLVVTEIDAASGDTLIVNTITATGFFVRVLDSGGSGRADKSIEYIATGY